MRCIYLLFLLLFYCEWTLCFEFEFVEEGIVSFEYGQEVPEMPFRFYNDPLVCANTTCAGNAEMCCLKDNLCCIYVNGMCCNKYCCPHKFSQCCDKTKTCCSDEYPTCCGDWCCSAGTKCGTSKLECIRSSNPVILGVIFSIAGILIIVGVMWVITHIRKKKIMRRSVGIQLDLISSQDTETESYGFSGSRADSYESRD